MNKQNLAQWRALALAAAFCVASQSRAATASLSVQADRPVQADFRGLGFNHGGLGELDEATWNTVFVKRLTEINPQGFSRLFCPLTGWAPTPERRDWDAPEFQRLCRLLTLLKHLDHDVYLTMVFWGKRPEWLPAKGPLRDPQVRQQWAVAQADLLEELVIRRGFTNIVLWCMTNELSSGDKADDFGKIEVQGKGPEKSYVPVNMPLFEAHHRAVFDELKKRGLEKRVLLLATDALGRVDAWRGSLPWAVEQMDDISGVYGVHDYPHGGVSQFADPDTGAWRSFPDERGADWADPKHYVTALLRYRYAAAMSKKTGKGFVLGEFGGATEIVKIPNGQRDGMRASETPELGLYLCERTVAGLNAGFSALAKWHLNDFKNTYGSGGWAVEYKHGTFRGAEQGWSVRPEFHAYGLLTRYLRKGSSIYTVTSDDAAGLLHAVAARHNHDGKVTVVVINRHPEASAIKLGLKGLAKQGAVFAKYQFDPARVPPAEQTTLHGPVGKFTLGDAGLADEIPAGAMAVYTDDCDPAVAVVPPPPPRMFVAEKRAEDGKTPAVTKEGQVLLSLVCDQVSPFHVRMKGQQKVDEQGKMPAPWSANAWDPQATVEVFLGAEPVTGAKAIGLCTVEGKAAVQFYTWRKVSLAAGRQYTVAFEVLAAGEASGRFACNGVTPKIEPLALADKGGAWKRCSVVINAKTEQTFSPQFQNLRAGKEHVLWIKSLTVTDTGAAKGDP
jgi:hypothetical protein